MPTLQSLNPASLPGRARRRLRQWRQHAARAWRRARFTWHYRRSVRLRPQTDTPRTPPVIVLGLYRSGTTLTTTLVETAGIDLGPDAHKNQGIGRLGYLNPEGFQENFMVNDLGRYILFQAGGSGVRFPPFERLRGLDLWSLDNAGFAYYSAVIENDDRVAADVRAQVLAQYAPSNLNQYFCDHFNTDGWGFKDVHCGLYLPVYLRAWPGARCVCVFRHPSSFLRSARDWKGLSPALWIEYYQRVLAVEAQAQPYWVAYESLLQRDPLIVRGLAAFVTGRPVDDTRLEALLALIKPALAHHPVEPAPDLADAHALYQQLSARSQACARKYAGEVAQGSVRPYAELPHPAEPSPSPAAGAPEV